MMSTPYESLLYALIPLAYYAFYAVFFVFIIITMRKVHLIHKDMQYLKDKINALDITAPEQFQNTEGKSEDDLIDIN